LTKPPEARRAAASSHARRKAAAGSSASGSSSRTFPPSSSRTFHDSLEAGKHGGQRGDIRSKKRVAGSVFEAIEQGYELGKRQVKARLVKHGQDYVLPINMTTDSNRSAAPPKEKPARKQRFINSSVCQYCHDGGDLICCDYCPVSMHFVCAGVTRNHAGQWLCPQHKCCGCGRKAQGAGGLLFRCTECPQAFCEDCLPANAQIVTENVRFTQLGYRNSKAVCYVICNEQCVKVAEQRNAMEQDELPDV